MASKHYEVAIVGAGITGTALAYTLARYTDIKKIALIEKYEDVGTLNSAGTSNSQTIHFGDIETNYTSEKAKITKRAGKMVEKYCLQYGYENEIVFSHQKMAMGVGDKEVDYMLKRYESMKELFPKMQVWDKEKLKELEPMVVFDKDGKERKENIVGVGSQGEWTTVNYGKMSKSFVENAKKEQDTDLELFLNTKIEKIEELKDGGFELHSENDVFSADYVVVNAGAHSLYLAHKMGHGLDYGSLSVAGSFYASTKKILRGKVYMVQNPKLPFAALHGDPDILLDGNTRFGPTALVIPKLERYKSGSYLEAIKALNFDRIVAKILFLDLLLDKDIGTFVFKNFLFELPGVNTALFLKFARKIVPSLSSSDIKYAKGFGGVRPQVLNKKERRLMLGEASVNPGCGIVFNMTPSPGATSCLANAFKDTKELTKILGKHFDEDRFNEELVQY